jgi:hypothetical protein
MTPPFCALYIEDIAPGVSCMLFWACFMRYSSIFKDQDVRILFLIRDFQTLIDSTAAVEKHWHR